MTQNTTEVQKQTEIFLAEMAALNMSPHTIKIYKKTLERYENYLKTNGIEAVNVEPARIAGFRAYIKNTLKNKQNGPINPSSIKLYMSAISSFYTFLIRNRVVATNPTVGQKTVKIKTKEPPVISAEQVIHIIKSIHNPHHQLIVLTLFTTGIRVSELCNLKVSDINFQTGEIRIFGKGGKNRAAYCRNDVLTAIQASLHGRKDGYVFTARGNNPETPISVRAVQHIYDRLAAEVGYIDGVKITPHKMRHAFATEIYRKSNDLRAVQSLLGHSSIATTSLYLHTDAERMKSAYNAAFGRRD